MREFKFRAWNKESKVMFDVDGNTLYLSNEGLFDVYPKNDEWYEPDIAEDYVSNKYELMQYTGHKDKNGKEIYEGDIVQSEYFSPSLVEFRDGCFMFADISYRDAQDTYEDNKWEIIGNIYENPDMLKEEQH